MSPVLCRCYAASDDGLAASALASGCGGSARMSHHCQFDARRSLAALEEDNTISAGIEMSQWKWLGAALVPGIERQPLKRLNADEAGLLKLLLRWRNEAGPG